MTLQLHTIPARELRDTDKLFMHDEAHHLMAVIADDDLSVITAVYEIENALIAVTFEYLTEIKVVAEICEHVSRRSYDHPGDPCDNLAVHGSSLCSYHN